MSAAPRSSPFWRWTGAAVAAGVLLRLRHLPRPLTADEAGALVVGRAWDAGRHLYVDTFNDRPQGVIVAFQQADALLGPSPSAARLLALVAGAATTVAVALLVRTVSGSWRAGAVAAWLVAVITGSAALEGHTANGELLAGALTVPAMALAAGVVCRRLPRGWMVAAGALGALGATVKQSGLDVLVAVLVWLVLAAWLSWRERRDAATLVGLLLLGAAAVLVPAALHGASLGWDAYAYAMVGFRARARSLGAGVQWHRLGLTFLVALPLLGPAVALGARQVRRAHTAHGAPLRPEHLLLGTWLGAAALAFLAGGNFHRHYWIQLALPVCAVAAVALVADRADLDDPRGHHARSLLVRALALPVAISLVLVVAPGLEADPRTDRDRSLATWLEEERRLGRAATGDDLLTLCASATFYAEAEQLPPYRYLWVDHVRHARGGVDGLVALLDGPQRPAYVALHQPLRACDPSGRLAATLEERYEPLTRVDGVRVWAARG